MKRLLPALAGVLLVSHAPSVQATILLNEIHLRTPPTSDTAPRDGNYEFVELKSDTGTVESCTDLWILVIENDGGGVGEVKEAWKLQNEDGTWMTTGPNGLLLLGDDYIRPDDNPYQFIKASQTTVGDPDGMAGDNLEDSNAVTVLLVRRSGTLPVPDPLTGEVNADFDVNDSGTGVFDWEEPVPPAAGLSAAPWTEIIDSVGFNGDQGSAIRFAYSSAATPTANLSRLPTTAGQPPMTTYYKGVPHPVSTNHDFMPHTLARSGTNNARNSRAAWYGGKVVGTAPDSLTYDSSTNYFNHIPGAIWTGNVTPGQPNLSSAPIAPVFRINEINLNPPQTPGWGPDATHPAGVANDGNFEFVEIINTTANQAGGTNFSGSLANYALLVVDSGGPEMGKIREAWDLSKFATGGNGLLVLGDEYGNGHSPFAGLFDPATQLGDPAEVPLSVQFSNLGKGDLDNNGVTLFLVKNFTGAVDQDIDAAPQDGILDATPWVELIDSVSVPEVDLLNNLVANQGGYSPARPDILVAGKHYNADNLSRIAGNFTPNSTGAWAAGSFGADSPYALSYKNGFYLPTSGAAFRGAASPGRVNYSAAALPVAGSFRVNEINIKPPQGGMEYVEIIGTAPHALMRDLWLIILDATPADSGRVKKVLDLRGQATGGNGLAILGDGIEEIQSPLFTSISGQTVRDDPESFNADGSPNADGGYGFTPDNSLPDGGVSVLLVSYAPGPSTPPVPVTPEFDLDVNNDGTLDAAPLWTLVDGVSTGNGVGGVPVLAPGFAPGNVSRYAGRMTANNADEWFGGELTGTTATSFGYGNHFGSFKGAASPGRINVTATPKDGVTLLLSEININPPGGDNEKEFVELRSADNSAMSTNGYSVLLIDNDGLNTGLVLEVWDLDGGATGPNGLLLAGVGYDTSVPWTGADAPNAATKLFFPDTMAFDDIGRDTDNGALTILLVKNFQGRAGDDLDEGTNTNLALDDDQIFNTPLPWMLLSDAVAMQGYVVPDPDVGGAPFYEGHIMSLPGAVLLPDLTATGFTPDTVARYANVQDANKASAWYGADLADDAGRSTEYDPLQHFPSTLVATAKVTPGEKNAEAPTDSSDQDGDGVVLLMELALGMDDGVSDTYKLPQPSMMTVNGVVQPAFTVVRPSPIPAGLTAQSYIVQASFNLQSWTLPTTLHSTAASTPAVGWETLTYLLDPNILPLLDTNKRLYFRLKVQRP